MRFGKILLILALVILCQGCFVFRYPTPEVRGSVVDATTKKPIADAIIQIRKHPEIFCKSSTDGTFNLRPNHITRFCFFMPGDYLVIAPLSISATNYQVFTNSYLGMRDGTPVVLERPIELQPEIKQK